MPKVDPPYRLDPLQTVIFVEWAQPPGGQIGGTPPDCEGVGYAWGSVIAITISEFNAFGMPNFPFDTTPVFPGGDWWEGGGGGMSHVYATFGYPEAGGATCPISTGGCDPLDAIGHPECFMGGDDPETDGTATAPPTSSGREGVETVGPGSTFGGYDW